MRLPRCKRKECYNGACVQDAAVRTVVNTPYSRIKRWADIVASAVLLIVLSPLLVLITLAIRIDSPGGVLYAQPRAGRGHKPFIIYKYRTMYSNTPSLSTEDMQKSGLNPVTRVGAFLRKTSLDELPQLWNILKGDMSFIGPRPALLTQTAVLQGREAGGVQQLLPGVTGLAQVLGRDSLSDQEKVALDTRYLHKMSFWFDCYILWLTVRAVITGKGAV